MLLGAVYLTLGGRSVHSTALRQVQRAEPAAESPSVGQVTQSAQGPANEELMLKRTKHAPAPKSSSSTRLPHEAGNLHPEECVPRRWCSSLLRLPLHGVPLQLFSDGSQSLTQSQEGLLQSGQSAMLSPRALGLRVWVLPTWQSLDETQVAGGCCHALVSAASLWVLWTALPLQFPFNKALAQRDYALKPHELNKPLRPELWALSFLSEQWEK